MIIHSNIFLKTFFLTENKFTKKNFYLYKEMKNNKIEFKIILYF